MQTMETFQTLDPYNRILVEVVVSPPCNGVELYKVVEGSDLPSNPLLGQP